MNKSSDEVSADYNYSEEYEMLHQSMMFKEDIYASITPFISSRSKKVTCSLVSSNEDFERKILKLFPWNYHSLEGFYFTEAILDTITYIAKHIVNDGIIIFEHIKYVDNNGFTSYGLKRIYGEKLVIKRKYITQTIPPEVALENNTSISIKIPKSKCSIIEFPKALGGKKKYLKILKELKELDINNPVLNFSRSPLSGAKGYNVMEHERLNRIELTKVTKPISWHHRRHSGDDFSGFYYVRRSLKFRRSQVILRDYIINELNHIISIIAKKEKLKTSLKIEGLLSLEEINQKISDWETGNLDVAKFNEDLY